MNYNFLNRIKIVAGFISFLALLLVVKLIFLQIVNKENYRDRADRQYATPRGNIFERGSIYFRNKEGGLVGAAITASGFKVAINPKEIENPDEVFRSVNNIIAINQEEFNTKANKKEDPYEEIAFRLSKEEADKVKNLKLKGVYVYKDNWRFYPGNELASNTLGYMGYKGDDYSGRAGLEGFYDKNLSRKSEDLYVNLFAEIFSGIGRSLFPKGDEEGDVVLTVEPIVQSSLEKTLLGIKKDWESDAVGGIIINPADGSIYALSYLPSFDPNNIKDIKDISVLSNPLSQNVYEFGSVLKALTMASGLDAGVVDANTTYNDKGFVILNNKKINNFDFKSRGVVDMQEVLNQSLNTGSVFVSQRLGGDRFKKYMLSFGFGEKTGVDLSAEASGLVDNLKSNVEVDYATTSFGQGIAFTPLEAVRAFSVIANGGYLITPHLAYQIDYRAGGKKEMEYPKGTQIISKEASDEVTRMLVEVVDTALLGGTVKMDRYSIAAKTGTAQISKGSGGGYYEDRYLHSFMGYLPAYDSKFLIFLYNVYPKGAKYASHTLTHPFMDLSKFLINYYNVPPNR